MLYKDFIQQIISERGQWGLDDNVYKEMHHILPICLGGQGDLDTNRFKKNSHHENCIGLTAYEHFIAHRLLMEEHPESAELKLAYCAMILWRSPGQQREYEVSAQEYEQARLIANEVNRDLHTGKVYSKETIEKRRKKMIGQKRTEETKQRISTATKAFYETESEEHRNTRIQHVSEATKQAMWDQDTRKKYLEAYYSDEAREKQKAGLQAFYTSEAGQLAKQHQSDRQKGKKLSEETKQKISEAQRGKVISEETKQRMRAAAKAKPPMSDETKHKLSLANKGKKLSNEHIEKLRQALKGKKQNPDAVQRRTEASRQTRELLKTKYAEYKACNGPLKWNDFQKVYQEIGEEIFNEINNRAEK